MVIIVLYAGTTRIPQVCVHAMHLTSPDRSPGSLSAKKLSFLVSIARMYLEENQSEIKRRLGDAYNPHHTVTLSLDITLEQERWMNPFSVPGPYPDAPQTFFMAVHFMQGAHRCARIFQFFPDWWAGKSRGMPYVQLSHSFFSVYLAF